METGPLLRRDRSPRIHLLAPGLDTNLRRGRRPRDWALPARTQPQLRRTGRSPPTKALWL